MDNTIEIHYKGTVHFINPDNSFSDQNIQDRILWIALNFNENKVNIDEVEWIWCLVGNIVGEHAWGENKEIRKGTKQFVAGAKVYCFPALWDGYENIKVIGKPRKRKGLITIVMRSNLITNWRLQQVYNPYVITEMLTNYGWNNKDESKSRIESMLSQLSDKNIKSEK